MKSIRWGTAAANCNLRGKKTRLLSCGCCVLFNLKDQVRMKQAADEIMQFKQDPARMAERQTQEA